MIELLNINGTAVSDIDYVEYLGTDFGDTEITNYNAWGKNSIAPRFVPIRRAQFQTAEVRFLIRGVPTQVQFEETITKLVMMLRSTSVPELNYNGFSFVGHCTDVKVNRIIKSQIAEVFLTVEGFKCVIETITNPERAIPHIYFEEVIIESPIKINFTVPSGFTPRTVTIEGETVDFGGLEAGNYSWNGLTHTLDKEGNATSSSGMSALVFPYARVGGTSIRIANGFPSSGLSITCYRRLL